MKEQVIHLDPHDNLISARDKLGWIRAERVLLVISETNGDRAISDKLDLTLLRREVNRRGADLALITTEPSLIKLCKEAGLGHFDTIEASHRHFWQAPTQPMTTRQMQTTSAVAANPADTLTRTNRVSPTLRTKLVSSVGKMRAASLLFAILGALIVGAPGATIKLTPITRQVTVSAEIIADPSASAVDTIRGIIPARFIYVTVEATAKVPTTGVRNIPSEKAHGRIEITNLTHVQLSILAGTVISTSAPDPIRFITLEGVTLAGSAGQTAEATIEAVEPGSEGNVSAAAINRIEGILDGKVAITNVSPTTSGADIQVQAISEADYSQAQALVAQQLQQSAFDMMLADHNALLGESEFLPVETVAVTSVEWQTQRIGGQGTELEISTRAIVRGIAIDEKLADQVIYSRLTIGLDSRLELIPDTIGYQRGAVTQIDNSNRVTFALHGEGEVSNAIHPEEIRAMLNGKTVGEAILMLDSQLLLADPPSIIMWPEFWPFMPIMPARISIDVAGK